MRWLDRGSRRSPHRSAPPNGAPAGRHRPHAHAHAHARGGCGWAPPVMNWLSQAPSPMAARKRPITTPVARAASPSSTRTCRGVSLEPPAHCSAAQKLIAVGRYCSAGTCCRWPRACRPAGGGEELVGGEVDAVGAAVLLEREAHHGARLFTKPAGRKCRCGIPAPWLQAQAVVPFSTTLTLPSRPARHSFTRSRVMPFTSVQTASQEG